MRKNDVRLNGLYQAMLTDLSDDMTPQGIRLRERARKRMRFHRPELAGACIDNFKAFNIKLETVDVYLEPAIAAEARYFITRKLEDFTTSYDAMNIQRTLDMRLLFDLWGFGPGASNGVKGTHTAEKIQQAMTCTQSAIPLVVQLRRNNPYLSAFDSHNKDKGIVVYSGSRLTTVPKNEDTERTIAIEPSGNMALQLAAGRYLEGTLRMIGLDIKSQQEKNRLLAREGSITGDLCTIDLKSASDSFKPELIRQLFPEEWYNLLMQIRSPSTALPSGEEIKLNMISTMGNGFTFPMMTLCLVALIYAYRRVYLNGPNLYIDWSVTAVFGDDIILRQEDLPVLKHLESCGLIINYDKSYCDGSFRESCGGDFDNGVDITPFYVKELLTNPHVYVALNQALLWSSRHRFLWHTITYLLGLIDGRPFLVPEWLNPDQGIQSVLVPDRYSYMQVVSEPKRFDTSSIFSVMLAVGGYLNGGPYTTYVARQFKTRYSVRKGRLPKGYLSGWDPVKGSLQQRLRVSNMLSICLNNDM